EEEKREKEGEMKHGRQRGDDVPARVSENSRGGRRPIHAESVGVSHGLGERLFLPNSHVCANGRGSPSAESWSVRSHSRVARILGLQTGCRRLKFSAHFPCSNG